MNGKYEENNNTFVFKFKKEEHTINPCFTMYKKIFS